ncbi:MAG: PQQ-binding-like beta-propeller repeat protein [Planctomycetota bacterium]
MSTARPIQWLSAAVVVSLSVFSFAADLKPTASSPSAPAASTATPWTSFRHDLAQTGVATSSLPNDLELLWEVAVGDQVLATAAIVGDHVYVPCLSGELVCLDRKTGAKQWAYKTVEVVEKNSFAPGFKSSPTVVGDSIYLGDEEGVFHAIDLKTGKGRWKFATGGEIYSSAAVVDGRVIFGSYDNRLYCLHAKSGELAWKYETQGYVHCAPAVIEGVTFIAGCDEHLRVIDIKTGEQRCEIPLNTYLIASPAVVGDVLYVGTYASEVVAVDWKQKEVTWRYASGESEQPFHSSAAVTNRLVVVGGKDKLVHAIDRATGRKAWTFQTRARIESSPVIVGERVFIGSHDGNLYGLNLADGKELWKFNAGKPISAGPAVGEGVLVVGSESRDGKVYCFGKKTK